MALHFNLRAYSLKVYIVAIVALVACSLPSVAAGVYDEYKAKPLAELCKMGYAFMSAGKPDSALVCLSIVAARHDEAETLGGEVPYLSAKAMNTVGFLYSTHFYDYDKAIQYYIRAEAVAAKHGYKDLLAKCYLNMGSLYRQYDLIHNSSKMGTDAMAIYKKAFALGMADKDWTLVVLSAFDMLGVADGYGMQGKVRKEMRRFLSLPIPRGVPLAAYTRCMAQGLTALDEGKYAAALSFFDSMRRLADRSARPVFYRLTAEICRCKVFLRKEDMPGALAVAVGIDSVARSQGFNDILLVNLAELEKIHRKLGDETKARKCRVEYLELKERIVESTKIDNVRDAKFLKEIGRMNEELEAERMRNAGHTTFAWTAVAVAGVLLLLVGFVVVYRLRLKRRQIKSVRLDMEQQAEKDDEKYSQSTLTEADKDAIFKKIKAVMETSADVYDYDFTLGKLSETVGVHYRFVSQVINERYGKNFKLVLNAYRISEACRRLKDRDNYGGLTIEAVAASVGFKSRSNFIAVFKRETGLTPKEFMKGGTDEEA